MKNKACLHATYKIVKIVDLNYGVCGSQKIANMTQIGGDMFAMVEIKQWKNASTEVIISGPIPTYQAATQLADKSIYKLRQTACMAKVLIIQTESMEDIKKWVTARKLPIKQDGELYYFQDRLSPST